MALVVDRDVESALTMPVIHSCMSPATVIHATLHLERKMCRGSSCKMTIFTHNTVTLGSNKVYKGALWMSW